MESPNTQNEKIKSERTRGERLKDILNLIDLAPQVDSAEEAFNLVDDSFSQIEKQEKEPRMGVGLFRDMLSIKINDRKIHYTWYLGHILLIGENGSIEIREKQGGFNREDFEKDHEYINKFNIIYSKLGANNQGVR